MKLNQTSNQPDHIIDETKSFITMHDIYTKDDVQNSEVCVYIYILKKLIDNFKIKNNCKVNKKIIISLIHCYKNFRMSIYIYIYKPTFLLVNIQYKF